ncbi:MAG: SDR family oxidoreductase [Candidatus Cloacimonetes bacterium]|nr:SDR family oxidoreductase [Candidatus Cloacimonadota bacterium]
MAKKAIVISGGNGNVGSYFADQLAKKGENLVLILHESDHRAKPLLQIHPHQIYLVYSDLALYDHLHKSLTTLFREKEIIPKALIHTATLRSSDFHPLADSPVDMWHRVVEVNLKGTFNILKILIPYFREQHYGKIVLFGSNVTRIGLPRGSAYAAAKAGIANLGRSLAVEEGGNNILINTISPGPIKIDDRNFTESYRLFRQQYYQENLKQIPLKRYATFADIFGLCRFLISEDNAYITGEEFFITGGKI